MITVYTRNVRGFYNGENVEDAIHAARVLLRTSGAVIVAVNGRNRVALSGFDAQRDLLSDADERVIREAAAVPGPYVMCDAPMCDGETCSKCDGLPVGAL
jgi:hypothetical protein